MIFTRLLSESLRARVTLGMAVAALATAGVVGAASYKQSSDVLREETTQKIMAMGQELAHELLLFSESVSDQLVTFADSADAIEIVELFAPALDEAGASAIRTAYLGTNGEAVDAGDGSTWSSLHAEYHPRVRAFQERFGHYDVFVVSTSGDVVYSVAKEDDFGTNLRDGPHASSGLGSAVQAALNGTVFWTDVVRYAPSDGRPAVFVAAPIHDNGAIIGAAAFEVDIDRISGFAADTHELGESGEAFLVGPDGVMRSSGRFHGDDAILRVVADLPWEGAELTANSATSVYEADNGTEYLIWNQPVEVLGGHFSIVTQIETAEALAPVRSLGLRILLTAIGGAILAAGVGFVLAGRISTPVVKVANAANRLARGALDVDLAVHTRDETGHLAAAVGATVEYLHAVADAARAIADGDLTVEFAPVSDDDILGQAFVAMIESLRSAVADAQGVAAGVEDSASLLARAADESAHASKEVASAIGSVAAGATSEVAVTESLKDVVATITREIETAADAFDRARDASNSAQTEAGEGTARTGETTAAMDAVSSAFGSVADSVEQLQDQFTRVEEIVELIGSIAEQTNLLALNAAIEAARAGDVGRGFAVVATEVKALAEESSDSTERIAEIVHEMKRGVASVVKSTGDGQQRAADNAALAAAVEEAFVAIAERVGEIDVEVQESIAATKRIEAAAREITSSTDELAALTHNDSAVAEEVAATSEQSAATAGEIKKTAGDLARSAADLTSAFDRFKL